MRRRKSPRRTDCSRDFEPFQLELTEPVREVLARSASPGDEWLWCLYCERFFQARFLRWDYQSNREGCAFCDCAGFDCAIFKWDTFRNNGEPWPKSAAELRHGLPLHPTLH